MTNQQLRHDGHIWRAGDSCRRKGGLGGVARITSLWPGLTSSDDLAVVIIPATDKAPQRKTVVRLDLLEPVR